LLRLLQASIRPYCITLPSECQAAGEARRVRTSSGSRFGESGNSSRGAHAGSGALFSEHFPRRYPAFAKAFLEATGLRPGPAFAAR